MPTRGGVPKRITPLTPSYMHGWSPDAKWLTYTAGRPTKKDPKTLEWDIYKIAVRRQRQGNQSHQHAGPR